MIYLKAAEEQFLRPDLFSALTLTGDPGAVRKRIPALAESESRT